MTQQQPDKWGKTFLKWLHSAWFAIKEFMARVFPGRKAWIGAGLGIAVFGYLFMLVMSVETFLPVGWLYFLAVAILLPLVFFLGAAIVVGLGRLLFKLPALFLILMTVGILLSGIGFGLNDFSGLVVFGSLILVGSLLGAGFSVLKRRNWCQLTSLRKGIMIAGSVLGLLCLILVSIWLINPFPQSDAILETLTDDPELPSLAETVPDPSLPGEYPVEWLTYGSGTDKRRSEYAEGAAILTESVDGSVLVSNWTGLRTAIWGFDASELPLNGRVWYPDGEGPFPLVLVVHGNHLAEDVSDPGYGYLCELLASRGNICVSVDENFLNGSGVGNILSFKQLSGENDLRGWLLLEHLSLWEDFVKDPESLFYGKVDFDRIALIGHSRGGEAIAVAALFNNLPNYPDNAKIEFDYGFNIRSLVAIAPVDGQYQPAGESIRLTDINYLILQGSHDMDVASFDGLNLYERVQFSGAEPFFKSAIYIWGANHGQFNTIWGNSDVGSPLIWLYNRKALIPADDQQQTAKVMVSAFLEATLHDDRAYLPLFQNVRMGRDWLPENLYLNAYADSNTVNLATFEEDLNVTTGTLPEIEITAQHLSTWREDHLPTKWGEMDEDSAVLLGWNRAGEDVAFNLFLPVNGFNLEGTDQLILSVAQAANEKGEEKPAESVDFSIELIDAAGEQAVLPMSNIMPVQPQWTANIYRLGFLSDKNTSEPFLLTYLFNLRDFQDVNPQIDLDYITQIRVVFNLTEEGNIWLDNLGFRIDDE